MIGLDLSTDVNHVKEIIMAYLKEHPLVLEKPESNVIVKQLGEFTIDVQVLFWVDILKQRAISPSYLGATIRSQIINDVRPAHRTGFKTALFAGDARSLRLRRDHPMCRGLSSDLVVTDLMQVMDWIYEEGK